MRTCIRKEARLLVQSFDELFDSHGFTISTQLIQLNIVSLQRG